MNQIEYIVKKPNQNTKTMENSLTSADISEVEWEKFV
jgi:hypothetical protein